jgi:hypothetical protein
MSEAIPVIEIVCSKPMMHMDTCLKIFKHILDIVNECCTFSNLLALYGIEHLTDIETENILKPPQQPHTQIHPQCDLVP